jgi:hypothetical protein
MLEVFTGWAEHRAIQYGNGPSISVRPSRACESGDPARSPSLRLGPARPSPSERSNPLLEPDSEDRHEPDRDEQDSPDPRIQAPH